MIVPATLVGIEAWMAFAGAAALGTPTATLWAGAPTALILLACIAISDFAGYWRHRLMHVAALWPAHAIHHSDRHMTWLALARFHPVNRAITVAINIVVLSLCGFPAWAIVLNGVIRNWYGHFLHADLPWTYGPVAGRVLVSPVLHRWHHTRDEAQSGRNFSTLFALWDALFGTWYCPHRKVGALGIDDTGFPTSWAGQMVWPFRIWACACVRTFRWARRDRSAPAPPSEKTALPEALREA